MTTIGSFAVHPAAEIFPMLDGEAYAGLLSDIRARGLLEAIWRIRGDDGEWHVLDGRNRLRACLEADVAPTWREYVGDEPMAFVWSLNAARRHLNASQEAMARARALPLFQAEAKARMVVAGRAGGSGEGVENLPPPTKARDAAAAGSTVSGRTIQHAATVLAHGTPDLVRAVERGKLAVSAAAELARLPVATQTGVLARADTRRDGDIRGGLVRALVRQETKAEVGRQIAAEPAPMPTGPYRVIVADPPWAYTKRAGDASHRGDLPYPPMTTDEICALDVSSIAHDDAVLWLWTTNAFMRDAYRVLDAWGFEERTILTWAKDRMGLGDWLRGQTEHCIMAARGKPTITLVNQTTLLNGPLREHSRKPDEFYSLVDALCPGSKVEMFCRTPRAGWAMWGAETEKYAAQ